jgi:hypothetical protein
MKGLNIAISILSIHQMVGKKAIMHRDGLFAVTSR